LLSLFNEGPLGTSNAQRQGLPEATLSGQQGAAPAIKLAPAPSEILSF
jgi:hypothetical protein